MRTQAQRLRILFGITLWLLDMAMLVGAFYLAYQLRTRIAWPTELVNPAPFRSYTGLMVVHIVSVTLVLFASRQYYVPRAASRVDQLYAIFAGVSAGSLFAVAIATFVFRGSPIVADYPRAMTVYAWLLSIILLMVGRGFHQTVRDWLRSRGIGRDRLILVGSGEIARAILQRIQWSPQLGYEVLGVVAEGGIRKFSGVTVLGTPEQLPELIERYRVDEVIIAMPEEGHRATIDVVGYCQRGRVSIKIFPDVFQFITSQATIDELGGLPLLSVRDFAMRGYMLAFKRLMDLVGAAVGLVALSPLMLLVALAIKLESSGPVFFIQERMGLDGRSFPMIKFRSMRTDAESTGPAWTVDNDPRRTRIGTLIRKINVDETPQLINVLLGEMSLVGPRPEQPYYVEQFRRTVPGYMDRHREKAGLTGWAQVNGMRGDTSIDERTKFDLWYIENWSLFLDVKILIRTVWQMLTGRNIGG